MPEIRRPQQKIQKLFYHLKSLLSMGLMRNQKKTECRLPQDKIVKINTALISAMHRKKITLRSLQSFIGLLNIACMVVCPGRTFLCRLIDLTMNIVNPFHFIRLTCEARADLQA